MKRGQSGLSCLVAIDKPVKMTSHDVVNVIRQTTAEKRVGHAGTLDPAASGLLVIGIGPATRLLPYLSGQKKRYRATIRFGTTTDTDDADGRVIQTLPVGEQIADESYAKDVLAAFLGTSKQMPPRYSAIKKNGQTAYAAARKGEELELDEREITVFEATPLSIERDAWIVEFEVSKGTYIRALARDIGRVCDTCAHLTELVRLSAGKVSLDDAQALATIKLQGIESSLIDPVQALGIDDIEVVPETVTRIENGQKIKGMGFDASFDEGELVSFSCEGRLRAIYKYEHGLFKPQTVIAGGVRRLNQEKVAL